MWLFVFVFFFFKQKTAYEMRISDWSSDVCSSDLRVQRHADPVAQSVGENADGVQPFFDHVARVQRAKPLQRLIDRAGGRDQRLICVRAQGGQSRRVLAVKTGLKLGHLVGGKRHWAGRQRLDKGRQRPAIGSAPCRGKGGQQ